jgi:hypothetical protein
MFQSDKQTQLNELHDEGYQQFKDDIADIEELIPKLRDIDYRLFDEDDDYSLSFPQSSRASRSRVDDDPVLLAQDFLDAIYKINVILVYYPLKELPLYLELFADCVDACSLDNLPHDESRFNTDEIYQLNRCVRRIQRCLREEDTVKEIKRIERQGIMQTRSVRTYIDQLFNSYAKLQVIRIDFHYQKGLPIRYAEIHQHREQLIRYLREKHLGHAHVGFIWKLEYGLRKSYHLHMVIFMDGSKVQQSVSHGKVICDHWNKEITRGKGTSFNCNANMSRYRECGIGEVNYYDENKINALYKACHYLTKYDPYIDIMQQAEARALLQEDSFDLSMQIANGRVFGRGQLPRIRPKLGRVRSRC